MTIKTWSKGPEACHLIQGGDPLQERAQIMLVNQTRYVVLTSSQVGRYTGPEMLCSLFLPSRTVSKQKDRDLSPRS